MPTVRIVAAAVEANVGGGAAADIIEVVVVPILRS